MSGPHVLRWPGAASWPLTGLTLVPDISKVLGAEVPLIENHWTRRVLQGFYVRLFYIYHKYFCNCLMYVHVEGKLGCSSRVISF